MVATSASRVLLAAGGACSVAEDDMEPCQNEAQRWLFGLGTQAL